MLTQLLHHRNSITQPARGSSQVHHLQSMLPRRAQQPFHHQQHPTTAPSATALVNTDIMNAFDALLDLNVLRILPCSHALCKLSVNSCGHPPVPPSLVRNLRLALFLMGIAKHHGHLQSHTAAQTCYFVSGIAKMFGGCGSSSDLSSAHASTTHRIHQAAGKYLH